MKKSQGRRKIEIKKIANEKSRAVTFSKRYKGIFKKASELSTLSGAEIAIIFQSMAGNVFAFGHPNPNVVIDRYLIDSGKSKAGSFATCSENAMQTNLNVQQYNQYYSQLCRELEAEKQKKEIMTEEIKNTGNIDNNNNGESWWNEPIDEMRLEELEDLMVALVELKKECVTVQAR